MCTKILKSPFPSSPFCWFSPQLVAAILAIMVVLYPHFSLAKHDFCYSTSPCVPHVCWPLPLSCKSTFAHLFSSSSPNLPNSRPLSAVSHIAAKNPLPVVAQAVATSPSPWRPWSAFAAMEAANPRAPVHWFPTWRTWHLGAILWGGRTYFSIGKWWEKWCFWWKFKQ